VIGPFVAGADQCVARTQDHGNRPNKSRRVAQWLAPRGLVFNEDKTRIVHLEEGFNFLGFNLRRYRVTVELWPRLPEVRELLEREGLL
jgi:RNA-directed DNA polymerase